MLADTPGPATGPSRPRRSWRRLPLTLRIVLCAGLLLGVLYLVRVPILVAVANVLFVGDPLRPSDAILVLGGEVEVRPARAAELYHERFAPRLLVVGMEDNLAVRMGVFPSETDATVRLLVALGVPRPAITVLNPRERGAASTVDEAAAFRDYVVRTRPERVIVVTSRYHTRRARWALRRSLGDQPVEILMAGAESPAFNERNWWRSEEGLIRIVEEYLKFAHNWIYR